MSEIIKIRKGLNIRIKGKAEKIFIKAEPAGTYAVKPPDFKNITPKLLIKPGELVKAGAPLFYDKYNPEVKFASPVSGQVLDVIRGERRRILEIVIKADKKNDYHEFKKADHSQLNREEIIKKLLESGTWPYIRQRPYNIIANPGDIPKSVFISAFDTAPLAPDYDFIIKDSNKEFQAGVDVLKKLTSGNIYLNVDYEYPASSAFLKTSGVVINKFKGPHPAGNVGIQIHKLDPVNAGEKVWSVNPQDVVIIGRLFLNGIYDASKVVALTGSEVITPRYYKLIGGTSIEPIVRDNIEKNHVRYISGNVLTGTRISPEGYVGFYDSQITVIPEGDEPEFLGWAMPGFGKFSHSRSFWSWLFPDREYRLDTNMHGGERAYVITGQYEKVLPMDIYPVQLVKSILIEDIELMEKLGIYEVVEEDMALCEFICTSKIEVQDIIRKGIDLMIKELGN